VPVYKTCIGEIDFSVSDEDLIEEDILMNYHHFKIKELVNMFLAFLCTDT